MIFLHTYKKTVTKKNKIKALISWHQATKKKVSCTFAPCPHVHFILALIFLRSRKKSVLHAKRADTRYVRHHFTSSIDWPAETHHTS